MKFLIGFLVVLICISLYYYSSPKTKDSILLAGGMIDYKSVYQKSAGTFDGPVQKIVADLKQKKRTPVESGFLGQVISETILEGETPIRGNNARKTMEVRNLFGEMFQGDPINNELLAAADDFNTRLHETVAINADILFPADAFLDDYIYEYKAINNKTIKEQQKSLSESAGQAIIGYFDAAKTHTSDNQNSHDTNVSNGVKASINIIGSHENGDEITKLIAYIKSADLPADKKDEALRSINIIIEKNETSSAAGKKELDVIKTVWCRAEHPNNKENQLNIKDALVDALIDIVKPNGWNENYAACASGRVSRIVGSLAALDYDNRVGGLMTKEQVDNHILENAGNIVNKFFEKHKTTRFAPIVAEYNTKNGPADSKLLAEFRAELSAELENMFLENNAAADIKNKVYAGLE